MIKSELSLIINEEILNCQYESFKNLMEQIIENDSLVEFSVPSFLKNQFNFVQDLAKQLKTDIKDLAKLFMNRTVFTFFSKIKWSINYVFDLAKKGFKIYKDILDAISEYVSKTKVGQWTEEQLIKLDNWLKAHPKMKRIVGIGVAALLIYMWFNMTFTGDFKYDFDLIAVVAALGGSFTLAKLFAGKDGFKLLLLFATGMVKLSFPWPGPTSVKFLYAMIQSFAQWAKTKMKIKKENIIKENPDSVKVKSGGEYSSILDWRNSDAIPFGYYKNNKMYVGTRTGAHFEILDNYKGIKNVDPNDYQRKIGREHWKYPGRIWIKNKVVSFWVYPSFNQLTKVLQDVEKELKSKLKININIMSFKLEIPAEAVDGGTEQKPLDYNKVSSSVKPTWRGYSYLYAIKNVLKPGFKLKGYGEKWKRGEDIKSGGMDIQHQIPAMLRKGAANKLNPEQKKALSDYFSRKGSFSKEEKRMWDMIARNKKIQRETREFILEHLLKYRKTKTINESPDEIAVDGKGTGMVRKKLFYWNAGINHPFGYYKGKMSVGKQEDMHADMSAGCRSKLKNAGRMWIDKKIISFWEYPSIGNLRKVLNDIEKAFDERRETGKKLGEKSTDFSKFEGKLKITNDWRIDIPAGIYKGSGDTSYKVLVGGGIKVADFSFAKAYLYKISTVLSGKPLKGIGEKLRGTDDVKAQGIEIQHQLPGMLRKGAANKLNPEQKKALSDYFSRKGSFSKEEHRMWKMIARNMGLKESEIFGEKIFTLEEGSGILLEAPHITVGKQSIDLEFEQGKLQGLKRILNVILGREVIDKYGNRFKLNTTSEILEFVKTLSKNYQVRSELK